MSRSPTPTTPRPPWLPDGLDFQRLPAGLQAILLQVIQPLYQMLVLEEPDELLRTVGLSVVHLSWLEVCSQTELGQLFANHCSAEDTTASMDQKAIALHLKLFAQKSMGVRLLLQGRRATSKNKAVDSMDPLRCILEDDS